MPILQEVNRCKSDQFQCRVGGECVLSVYVCDGHWDCDNGADEADCGDRRGLYEEYEKRGGMRLAVPYVERWLDTSAEACAMHCSVRWKSFPCICTNCFKLIRRSSPALAII